MPKGVRCSGGERGIRTLETVSRLHAFQACAFNHSATSPAQVKRRNILRFGVRATDCCIKPDFSCPCRSRRAFGIRFETHHFCYFCAPTPCAILPSSANILRRCVSAKARGYRSDRSLESHKSTGTTAQCGKCLFTTLWGGNQTTCCKTM
jgi:hypothetical protein